MIDVWACCTWFTPIYTYMISPIIKHTTATAQGGYMGRITCENCDFWHHGFIFHKICYILALIVFSSWKTPWCWPQDLRLVSEVYQTWTCFFYLYLSHANDTFFHIYNPWGDQWVIYLKPPHWENVVCFPKFSKFSQNGQIFRPIWEQNRTISQNFLAIFPVQCNIAVVYLEETWSNSISITCCNICGKSMK